jgi:hypothetical protein
MSTRALGSTSRRRLVAIGLSTLAITAVVATLAVTFMTLNAHTAYGSGTGPGGGCIPTHGAGVACVTKGMQASADFTTFDANGCVVTDANINAFQNIAVPGHSATQSVMVFISVYDICNQVQLVAASNVDPNTGATLFNGASTFGAKLDTASVNGAAPMFDFVSGTTFTSTVNVTWSGFGPTSSFAESFRSRSPGFMVSFRDNGSSRQAEATGTVTDSANNNLAATPTDNADLSNNTSGTVQIIKQ